MTEQKIITEQRFATFTYEMKKALSEGWKFVPTSLFCGDGQYMAVVEKTTEENTGPSTY